VLWSVLRVLQCVALYYSMLQCIRDNMSDNLSTFALRFVAVCCRVLPCVAVCCSVLQCLAVHCCAFMTTCLTAHLLSTCSALHCVAVSVLQCVAIGVRCSVLQCVAVRYRVLQCVDVRYSVLQYLSNSGMSSPKSTLPLDCFSTWASVL